MMDEKKLELLLTRYGMVAKNGRLEIFLDKDDFLKWVAENRFRFPKRDEMLEEDWILLYKVALSRSYATRYHELNERIP
jgi:hypothetical protein